MAADERPRLHLDADVSIKELQRILQERGFDVTRTPNEWLPEDADDERQLQEATRRGRVIFTYNVRHFALLSKEFPNHAGIILGHQYEWNLSRLLKALDRLLTETTAVSWQGQVRWLNDWLDD
jgi:hypothetical protein